MLGQDAVKSAQEFHESLGFNGFILTKMDGDARGGAALSIKQVTGQPVKFVGMGEKYDALEVFHPDRLVSRIIGMGDIMSLIEKAQEVVDKKQAVELQEKMLSTVHAGRLPGPAQTDPETGEYGADPCHASQRRALQGNAKGQSG